VGVELDPQAVAARDRRIQRGCIAREAQASGQNQSNEPETPHVRTSLVPTARTHEVSSGVGVCTRDNRFVFNW
jgi:hypothetical protein